MSEAPSARVAVLARAKVNLYLHVLGQRPDGYHLLDSLVVFADVGDRIEVAAAESLRLAIDGPFAAEVPAGDDNLVLRAARALAQAVGRPAAAAIRLTKSLPVASGIGGGSADAAATLRALVRLWRLDIDGERLAAAGAGARRRRADVSARRARRSSAVSASGSRRRPSCRRARCCWSIRARRCRRRAVFARRRGPFSQPGRFGTRAADARAQQRGATT